MNEQKTGGIVIAGIRIAPQWSVLVLIFIIAAVLATDFLPATVPSASVTALWIAGGAGAAGIVLSLLIHELTHAAVARHYGMATAEIRLWMLGGTAMITDRPPSARAEARIAAAGPLSSAAIGLLLAGLCLAGDALGWTLTAATLAYCASANGIIAVFNALPAFPLDGGRLLHSAIWRRRGDEAAATRIAAATGNAMGIGLVLLGGLLFVTTLSLSGIWLAIVGWFLAAAAGGEARATGILDVLDRLHVGDVMEGLPDSVPNWITLTAFLDDYAAHSHATVFPLRDFDGRAAGAVTLQGLLRHLDRGDAMARLGDAADPGAGLTIDAAAPVTELIGRRSAEPLIVTRDGAAVGVVSVADVKRALDLARAHQVLSGRSS